MLWTGEFISAIGSGLCAFGIGIYVINLTGKASDVALITFLSHAGSWRDTCKLYGRLIGVGNSRGIGLLIKISGFLIAIVSVVLYNMKSVRNLESGKLLCSKA